jgi:glycerol uptake facilitator-like aquaporin
VGTAFLLAAVVGAGTMAAKLAGGNIALALLCNTIPTGTILVVLILIFGPISGAHFNPAVTLAFASATPCRGGLCLSVIKAASPDRSDQPLRNAVLPRRSS